MQAARQKKLEELLELEGVLHILVDNSRKGYAAILSEGGCKKGVTIDFVSVVSNTLWRGFS